MNIWSCKAPAVALALGLLAGCDSGMGESLLADFSALKIGDIATNITGGATDGPDVALSQSSMAFGAVDLVAPKGFCIDKRSLKQQFALLARCDKLGVPSAAADAPVGIITASFTNAIGTSTLPSPTESADALGLQSITNPVTTANSVIYRASGGPSVDGASTYHWRGTARIGTQLVGLALHAPQDGQALTEDGRRLLAELVSGSSARN